MNREQAESLFGSARREIGSHRRFRSVCRQEIVQYQYPSHAQQSRRHSFWIEITGASYTGDFHSCHFDDIDGVYKTKGIVQIKALAEGEFTAREKKSSAFSFAKGSITLVNPLTGAVERTQLSLPYVTNWE